MAGAVNKLSVLNWHITYWTSMLQLSSYFMHDSIVAVNIKKSRSTDEVQDTKVTFYW